MTKGLDKMKTTRFVGLATIAAALTTLASRDASAAGTALDVQSGRGTGMASAQTAYIDDSSAIFYNPAGIAQGKVLDAQAGINLIAPSFKFKSKQGNETTLPFTVVTPFQAYVSGGVTDNLSLGIGIFTPFGLKLEWPAGWEGRNLITTAELRTFYINPTAAFRAGPFRIGAGFQLVRATVELQRDIRFGDQEGNVDLGAATWGVGGNVGVQLEAVKQFLMLGVHYRSPVKLSFDGQAHFQNAPRDLAGTIHDQNVSTSVIQPGSLAFGVATRPIKDLVIDLDAVWIHWDQFKSIDLHFPDDKSGSLDSTQAKNWSNTVNFHLGAEGTLSKTFQVRGGVLIDPSPSPENTLTPDIPDSTRVNLALGGTYRHQSGFHLDLGYQFIILTGKTSTAPQLPGEYGGIVNILGISVGYSTPPKPAEQAWVDPAAGPEPGAPPGPATPTPDPQVQPAPL